jgi:hippurate hydrolase
LIQLKQSWKGTLVVVGQPAEERGLGARAMLEAGLLRRFPRPDYALAFHVSSEHPAGIIATRSGFQLAAVDSIDIVVRGRGGHGAAPHKTVDPIVLGAQLVLALQTLVSRTIDPQKSAVLTVGSLHAGTKRNIIADRALMKLTLRTYEREVRKTIIAGIRRIAKNLAEAAGAPLPLITLSRGVPAVYNDPRLMDALTGSLRETFGADKVVTPPRVMMGEDFALYYDQGRVRSAMFFVGVQPKKRSRWHPVHSPRFLPDYKRALPVAVKAMTSSALHLLRHRP